MLIEKPPVGGRELLPLPPAALSSFRIMPGSVSTQPNSFSAINQQLVFRGKPVVFTDDKIQ